jgi:hypothetical protein
MDNTLNSNKDLFLDANILIELINICGLSNPQSNDGARLVNFGATSFIGDFEKVAQQLTAIYEVFCSNNLYVTEEIKKQVRRGELDDLTERIRDRFDEHAFIQVSPSFNSGARERATTNLLSFFLPHKSILGLVKTLLDDPLDTYQNSRYFEPIREFISHLDFNLKVKKGDHKYDDMADQKLVASVLDNQLIKRRKSAVVSRDKDVINLLSVANDIISSVGAFSEGVREYSRVPPVLYRMDALGNFSEQTGSPLNSYLSAFDAKDQKYISGRIGKQTISLLEKIGFY